jgi:hypothetical protein
MLNWRIDVYDPKLNHIVTLNEEVAGEPIRVCYHERIHYDVIVRRQHNDPLTGIRSTEEDDTQQASEEEEVQQLDKIRRLLSEAIKSQSYRRRQVHSTIIRNGPYPLVGLINQHGSYIATDIPKTF